MNLATLFKVVLSLPLSTASCERGFSAMKRIKSDWRSSLATSTLSMLLYVSVEGPEIQDYNCLPALERWWFGRERQRRV